MGRKLLRIVLTVVVLTGSAMSRKVQATLESLVLRLECVRAADLTFRFTVENATGIPTTIVLGAVLGGDTKRYLPGGLGFTLKRPGMADSNFDYVDPSVGVVGGQVGPWIVPLPARASYSVAISIPKGMQYEFAASADVQIRLVTRPLDGTDAVRFPDGWSGRLTSDWIRFPDDCRAR